MTGLNAKSLSFWRSGWTDTELLSTTCGNISTRIGGFDESDRSADNLIDRKQTGQSEKPDHQTHQGHDRRL